MSEADLGEMSAMKGDFCPERLSDIYLLTLLMFFVTPCGGKGNNKPTETVHLEESCQIEKFVSVVFISLFPVNAAFRAGEMAQHLRALTALPEVLSSILSNLIVSLNYP